MSATLTLDALEKMVAQFGKPLRIIVGFPFVPVDSTAKHERENLLLIGHSAWSAFKRTMTPANALWNVGVTETFRGVRVEFYGDRDDHEALLRKIVRDLTATMHPERAPVPAVDRSRSYPDGAVDVTDRREKARP